jgi:hypothetical protein
VALCIAQPLALPVLPAVTADVPLALPQPIVAAMAALLWHAAFISGVHCAAISAVHPEACVFPFAEATTAFVVVVDPAFAVLALLWASHAWATVAVQANAIRARTSSRSDFMVSDLPEGDDAEGTRSFGEQAPLQVV